MTGRNLTGEQMLAIEVGPPIGVGASEAERIKLHERQLHAFLNIVGAARRAGLVSAEDEDLMHPLLFRLTRDLREEQRDMAASAAHGVHGGH